MANKKLFSLVLATILTSSLSAFGPPVVSIKNAITTIVANDITPSGTTQQTTGTQNTAPATSASGWASRTTTNGTPLDDDILYGKGSKNKINGLAGDDYIHPVNYEDWDSKGKYYGDGGNDWIELMRGTKILAYGGTGNDVIVNYHGTGWHSSYKMYGEAGNDKFYTGLKGNDDQFWG